MKRGLVIILLAAAALWTMNSGAQAADPIKLGAFFSLSGPAAPIGTPTKLVAEMVVDKINKEGGINGRKIELVVGDTESDAAKAATIAKKFIHSDKVAAIIGPDRTDLGMNVKKIVEEAGVPTFMTVGGDPVIMGGEKFGSFNYVFKSPQRSSTAVK
ncbi:MAG: ABC transporter substrate-binding protein, partial [Pseudomonadota bacterium]